MALVDWRVLVEVEPLGAGDQPRTIALEVTDAGAARPAAFRHRLRIDTDGIAQLDYYALGELVDRLREAMGVLLTLQGDPVATAALAGLARAHDTPTEGASE